MKRLIKAEIFKLFKSRFFWLLFAFTVVMGLLNGKPGVAVTGYMVYQIMLMPNTLYSGLLSLLAAVFVCDEFLNRTFGMSLFCGAARHKVLLAKTIVFMTEGVFLILLSVLLPMAVAAVGNGFGIEWNGVVAYEVMAGLVCFAFEGFFMGSFALFSALLVKDRIGTFVAGEIGSYMIMFLAQIMENTLWYGVEIFFLILGTACTLWVTMVIFMKTDLR